MKSFLSLARWFGIRSHRVVGLSRRTIHRSHPVPVEVMEARTVMSAQTVALMANAKLDFDDQRAYEPTQILVKFNHTTDRPDANNFGLGKSEFTTQHASGIWGVGVPKGANVERMLEKYAADPNVQFAQPDYVIHGAGLPNDAKFSQQWAHHNRGQTGGKTDADIDSPAAWKITKGTGQTIVAVIDTGIDWSHPDLKGNIWSNDGEIAGNKKDDDCNGFIDDVRGWDFVNWDNNPMDDNGHGTHVAGIIGAAGNNKTGVAGVSWDVQLMPLKFLGKDGSGYTSDALTALEYAVMNGASISNNSWGGGSYSRVFSDTIAWAGSWDHIFVAAAGNDEANLESDPEFPASYGLDLGNVVTVAATNDKDRLAGFSNYGKQTVDLAAPGVDILSTVPTKMGSYKTYSGTSMAAPYVTGALSLIRDLRPDFNYREAIDMVLSTVDKVSGLTKVVATGGRLNVGRAIQAANVARFSAEVDQVFSSQSVNDALLQVGESDNADDDAGVEAAGHTIPTKATYEITIRGKVNGKKFELTGKLRVRETMNELTLNDVNSRDVFLEIGDPLVKPKAGALWLATNNAFFEKFGYTKAGQRMDLANVDLDHESGRVTVKLDGDLTTSGLNRFNSSSGLLASIYTAYKGTMKLDFDNDGDRVSGSVGLKGVQHYIPGLLQGAVSYSASISGRRIA